MKRVPVTTEIHRKAKAKAAEMGLTLERYVGVIIDHAAREPAENIIGWIEAEYDDRQRTSPPVAAGS